jgi:hypothetical protein
VQKDFGGLAFVPTGSALKTNRITITNRLKLPCAAIVTRTPVARPACGLGAPSLTPQSGSLDPALASGTVTATADLNVRCSRSLAIKSASFSASQGVVIVSVKIGSHSVTLRTVKPRISRTFSDLMLGNAPLTLTSSGAAALGHALGTSLKAGGNVGTFGGIVVFEQANVVSGSAELTLPQTVTPTGTATGGGHALNLGVLPGIVPLWRDLGSLAGTLHLSGGAAMRIGGATVTLTGPSVTFDNQIGKARTDLLRATVNGHHVALANMKEASGGPSSNGTTETDDETSVTPTKAGAVALGGSYKSGSKFGTAVSFASVGR